MSDLTATRKDDLTAAQTTPTQDGEDLKPLFSVCPAGEVFPLPQKQDYQREWKRLQKLVKEQRLLGHEIVVVMGLGFVGAVMAAVVADVHDGKGDPIKFVIGMQRPSTQSYWKIPYINNGVSPIEAEDPEVASMISRCVKQKKTLTATFTYDALKLADIVIVDVQCDYLKESLGNVRDGRADMEALEESLEIIGWKINPETLVLIETTVAPAQRNKLLTPLLKRRFESVTSVVIRSLPIVLRGSCPERITSQAFVTSGESAAELMKKRHGGWKNS